MSRLAVRAKRAGSNLGQCIDGDGLYINTCREALTRHPIVFVSERGSPFTTAGFARMIERATGGAGLEIKAHPHMLRHACGYALANKGHDTRAIQGWLGHRSITSGGLHGAGAEPVPGLLEGLICSQGTNVMMRSSRH